MGELTWHQAIQHVLDENGGPMYVPDITNRVIELDLRSSYGATPIDTVHAQLSASVRREDTPYIKVSKAVYQLKSSAESPSNERMGGDNANSESTPDDSDDDAGLVQAFGMYWQRNSVHWNSSATVLGRQQIGANEVDFAGQLGVYLLHDGREVVYVGRSTDRPMGRRLYEHTKDRLQTRWNRFSWFGLLKVTEEGELVEAQANITADLIATTLEAVLIEGLEPRQNRRRGDGFNATEYLQAEDPEIERRQHLSFIDSLKSKF